MKNIRIDFDEVITHTIKSYLNLLEKETGIRKTEEDINTYHHMADDLNISPETCDSVWRKFYTENHTQNCELLPDAYNILNWLHLNGFNIEVITSRPVYNKNDIIQYLESKNLDFIKKVHCCNTYSKKETPKSKADVFKDSCGDFFVEDTYHHAEDVAKNNKDAVVFLFKKKWNEELITSHTPKNIIPVNGWYDVKKYLEKN